MMLYKPELAWTHLVSANDLAVLSEAARDQPHGLAIHCINSLVEGEADGDIAKPLGG